MRHIQFHIEKNLKAFCEILQKCKQNLMTTDIYGFEAHAKCGNLGLLNIFLSLPRLLTLIFILLVIDINFSFEWDH